MSIEIYPFDPSEYLDSPEAIAVFMSDIMESNDPGVIADGIGEVAKAKGMTALSKMTGIGRERLYASFGKNGNPTLRSLIAIMQALGLQLSAKPIKKGKAKNIHTSSTLTGCANHAN